MIHAVTRVHPADRALRNRGAEALPQNLREAMAANQAAKAHPVVEIEEEETQTDNFG